MHTKLLLLAFFLALQTFAFGEPLISPEVHADRSVTFRLRAPTATGVVVRCEGKIWPMQKDTNGAWSVSTEPLDPDIYSYSIVDDELRINDPSNPFLKPSLIDTESQVHVPGPATLPWEINDVPHGVIHRQHYKSKIIGEERDVLSTRRLVTIQLPERPIPCSICCMVSATPKAPGSMRGART